MIPFRVEDSLVNPKNARLVIADEVYSILGPVQTSYNILFPRLFGLSYADFMRMVRDKYKAVLDGRDGGWITFSIPKSEIQCINQLQMELIRRWNFYLENVIHEAKINQNKRG